MVTRSTTSRVTRPTTSAVTGNGVSGVTAEIVNPVFASDAFADADATALGGKLPDVGAAWIDHATATAVRLLEVRSNYLRMTSFTAGQQALFYVGTEAVSDTQEISCTVRYLGAVNNNNFGPAGYISSSANTFYGARYNNATGEWQLFKQVAGSGSNIGTYSQAISADTDYELKLVLNLGRQELWVNGVLRISATDTDIQARGFAGIRGTGTASETNSTGARITAFVAKQGLQVIDLFWSSADGGPAGTAEATYDTARIPSIAITNSGTIVVACEGRIPDEDDTSPNDTLLYRWDQADWTSVPNAEVFTASVAGSSGYLKTGPTLAYDSENDRLWMLWVRYRNQAGSPTYNQRNCLYGTSVDTSGTTWVAYSDDDGANWSTPVDITSEWKNAATESAVWTGNGCSGVVIKNGADAGRICFPIRVERGSEPSGSITVANHYASVIYSDDNGANWSRGADIPVSSGNATEVHISETPDGEIVAGVRKSASPGDWSYAVSDDGGETWGSAQDVSAIDQPYVNCGLAIDPSGNWYVTHPDNDADTDRKNLTVRRSTNSGSTWSDQSLPAGNYPGGTLIESTGAGYSSIVSRQGSYQDLLVVFERGSSVAAPYDRLSITSVPKSWITT